MRSNRRHRIIIAGLAFVSACALLSQVPAVQILYHQKMMNYWKAQGFTPQVDSHNALSVSVFTAVGDKFAKYEHHRLQLVRLGSLSFTTFSMPHPKASPRTAALQTTLKTQPPPHVDFHYTAGPSWLILEVYCDPQDIAPWRTIVQEGTLLPIH
jgi:hypothetical protein